jgi:hypothetical protein
MVQGIFIAISTFLNNHQGIVAFIAIPCSVLSNMETGYENDNCDFYAISFFSGDGAEQSFYRSLNHISSVDLRLIQKTNIWAQMKEAGPYAHW